MDGPSNIGQPSATGRAGSITSLLLRHGWMLSLWCMVAAFGAYACMYGFRKPFTAGTYSQAPFQPGFKVWLVLAQVLGYTISKFVGIKIIDMIIHALGLA